LQAASWWLVIAKAETCSGSVPPTTSKTNRAAESFRILRDDAKDVKLVIIDIDPEMHGVALLTAVAGFRENVPIVAVTSLEESYMKPLAVRRGAVECLGKPVAANRFAEAIQRHCGAREATGSTG
jgi:DNA-binding NtrC family response regulator